jgi:hypothetical protein
VKSSAQYCVVKSLVYWHATPLHAAVHPGVQ